MSVTERQASCYLSVPIRRCDEAKIVEEFLVGKGIEVLNPCNITGVGILPEQMPMAVSEECYRMMDRTNCTVLLLGEGDDFGRDCAAEVGYAAGSGKPVFGYAQNATLAQERLVGNDDLQVLGGSLKEVFDDLEVLAGAILRVVSK